MLPFKPVPETLVSTRTALHRLAAYVIAPVRYNAVERFGLHATPGGFGTPRFEDREIRVEGTELIDEQGGDVRRAPITSLAAAAEFLGSVADSESAAAEHDTPSIGDVDADLGIDQAASEWLGHWYGVTFAALEVLRTDDEAVDPSEIFLWPGHFDPGMETGDEDHRASYGASPGDAAIPEPYLYLSVWWPDKFVIDENDPMWNASGFTGAILKASDFDADVDPMEVAVGFWRAARTALNSLERREEQS